MNLAMCPIRNRRCIVGCCLAAALLLAAGCSGPELSSPEELARFDKAGPILPVVDVDRVVRARVPAGPYRVVPGDLLSFDMPQVMRALSEETAQRPGPVEPYACRVNDAGAIDVPAVGAIQVTGATLAEIESAVVSAYHPRYVVYRPSVLAKVVEYRTSKVSVIGGVEQPGVYELRSDEMSLIAVLMKAGGIHRDREEMGGAAVIRVHDPQTDGKAKELILPMKNSDIPFADVVLEGGQTVEVEWVRPRLFTVIGLVRKPGAYPYPIGANYSLTEAMAFAGGIDPTTEPRFVRIHRQEAGEKVISAVFRTDGTHLSDSCKLAIKPGDVISVDHTARTRVLSILAEYFRISAGFFLGARGDYRINPGYSY